MRWSLKHTTNKSIGIHTSVIDEAVDACSGVGGSGDVPGWGIRLDDDPKYDLVVLRAEDFEKLAKGEIELEITERKADAKRRIAQLPELFRDGH